MQFSYLAVQGLLVGQLIFQFVIEVMDGGGLSLGCQVPFLQCGDPLLHVLLLCQGLGKRWGCHILLCDSILGTTGLSSSFKPGTPQVQGV